MKIAQTSDSTCQAHQIQVIPDCCKKTPRDYFDIWLDKSLLLFLFVDLSSPCFFTCPPYNYNQDDDVITFIIDVADVALDTVSLGFKKNKVNITVLIMS